MPAFTPPEPTRIQLANGMVIFLQPDHELPLISATARIRGGSISEPADKTGLTDLYGDVWRTGGTKTKTGDQMDDFLEARAAKIETDNQSDSTSISLELPEERLRRRLRRCTSICCTIPSSAKTNSQLAKRRCTRHRAA